jgi:protein involved in polysaccharide export with SLBB domain
MDARYAQTALTTRIDLSKHALAGLLALSMVALAACSSAADRSDNVIGRAPILSPQQCSDNAALIRAASSSSDTSAPANATDYIIQPGDELSVSFYLSPEFNQDLIVRPDGKVSMKLIGIVQASGMTPSQLADNLDKDYLSELRSPGITISVKNMPSRQVYVQGQVGKPGSFPLEPGMTALQAIADAGGLTDNAGDVAVLIRRDACGTPYGSKVDLDAAVKSPSSEQDAILQPRDILVVPRSGIANLDLFVEQYIRNLMPIQPYLPLGPVPM